MRRPATGRTTRASLHGTRRFIGMSNRRVSRHLHRGPGTARFTQFWSPSSGIWLPACWTGRRLNDDALGVARELIRDVVQRSSAIDPEETAVQTELERCLETWEFRAPESYWWPWRVGSSLLQDAERAATLRAMGRIPGEAWPTLNNMRSVEPSTQFRLAERLRERPSGGNGDGQ